jgi:hypothetical protein
MCCDVFMCPMFRIQIFVYVKVIGLVNCLVERRLMKGQVIISQSPLLHFGR